MLAGGASTRMGTDKALVEVGGRRLVDLAVAALAPVCTRVVVACGRRRLDGLTVEQVPDAGEGPLGGIIAGLSAARTPLAAVVAVDMPFADAVLLRALALQWEGEAAVVPVADGRLQPLHAVYAVASAGDLARLRDAGERSITQAVLQLGARHVDVAGGRFAVNLNAPQDLAALGQAAPHVPR